MRLYKKHRPTAQLSGIYLLQLVLAAVLFLFVLVWHFSHHERASSLWDMCQNPSLANSEHATFIGQKISSAAAENFKESLKENES